MFTVCKRFINDACIGNGDTIVLNYILNISTVIDYLICIEIKENDIFTVVIWRGKSSILWSENDL